MTLAFAGLVAGFVHVLSGPDHLAAIAPYAVTFGTEVHLFERGPASWGHRMGLDAGSVSKTEANFTSLGTLAMP